MGLLRAKLEWIIPGAGTAHSVFHFITTTGQPVQAEADAVAAKLATFRSNIRPQIPSQVSLRPLSDIEQIDEASGDLQLVFTTAATTAQAGSATSTASWAAPVGGVISWATSGIRNARRVRGRTFVVPLSSVAFDTDGTLSAGGMTSLTTAANALMAADPNVKLAVYGRPTGPAATDGDAFEVVSNRVPDMGAILTSRRS